MGVPQTWPMCHHVIHVIMVEFGISLWESKLKKKVVVTPEDYEYFMNVKIVPHEVQRYIKIFLPLPYNLSDCLTKILKVYIIFCSVLSHYYCLMIALL